MSLLNAVTWITKDFFVLSKITALCFLHNFFALSSFFRNDKKVLFRELALFKLVGVSKKLDKAKKLCKKHNAVILDKTKKSFVIQVTALRREIDKLIVTLTPLGLVSASRTGAVAMTRGEEIFTQ